MQDVLIRAAQNIQHAYDSISSVDSERVSGERGLSGSHFGGVWGRG